MTDIEESLKRIYSSPGPLHPTDIAWLVTQVRWFLLENDQLKSEVEAARTEVATMRSWAEEAAKAENENAEVATERAAVVAWLRGQLCVPGLSPDEKRLLSWASRRIERGEHRRMA